MRIRQIGFNPRLPGGRRHARQRKQRVERLVSIHAFRGEGDADRAGATGEEKGFNPRLPGGRRPLDAHLRRSGGRFQSTPSGGKATYLPSQTYVSMEFQSTPSGGKATL